jgi:tetratricopeptide (TPR) repeat protein
LTKRQDEAKALIKEVLEANPRDSEALTLRGQFALAENQIPEAIADFRSVLVDQPSNVPVLKMLAAAHIRNNEDSLARENIEKVVAASPNDEGARLDLASLLMKAGQKEQAQQQVDSLLKNNPKSVRGLEAQFKLYLTEKQWDKAQAVAKQVQDLNQADPTGFYMAGLGQQAANKLDAAIEAFDKALSKKPDAIEPLNELIKTYMALKQPDKAIAKLQQVVKQQPDNVVAYNLIGGVDLSQQKFSEAKTAFNKALEIKPDWFGPYRSLALIALQEKNKAEAINILKTGISKTKGVLELVMDLSRIYHSDGEHDKVIALYEESYNAHPDSVLAINNLASYLSDYAPTSPNLARAAKITEPLSKSTNANVVDTIGWIAYKQGDYGKAKDMLQKAIELQPNALISHYHLGMTYFKQNDKAKATEELQKVVDAKVVFDGLETAKETLAKIQSGA